MKRVRPILGRKRTPTPCRTHTRHHHFNSNCSGHSKAWLSEWATHSSEQEEPVEPHRPCASLPYGAKRSRSAMTTKPRRAYQDSAADPHHEAADEGFHTGAPSQRGGFVDSLRKHTLMSWMSRLRPEPQRRCFTSRTVRSSLRDSSPLRTVFNLSMDVDPCKVGPSRLHRRLVFVERRRNLPISSNIVSDGQRRHRWQPEEESGKFTWSRCSTEVSLLPLFPQ